MKNNKKIKKYTICAVFGALAGAMQIFESILFSPFPIPGGRPGIANVVTMVTFYTLSPGCAFAVTSLKSLMSMFIGGSVTAFIYSICGGVASVFSMIFAKKHLKRLSLAGIGIIGALVNNITQTIIGAAIINNIYVLSYVWILGSVSVVVGIFTGLCAEYIIRKGLIKI